MKRLLVCLLLVGVVGCGESEQLAAVRKQMAPAQLALGDPIINSVGMLLVPIPADEFQMGSSISAEDSLTRFKLVQGKQQVNQQGALEHFGREHPQHQVKITKPFYLGANEVSQQQYEKVMGAQPWQGKDFVKEGADYPASFISHNDAVEFCRRLSKQEGVKYRLPTEAEWEFACRAGTGMIYSFGDEESKLQEYAWYDENSSDDEDWKSSQEHRDGYIGDLHAHRVGQKLPNRWSLYDMHGNVMEWCQDWYAPYGSEKVVSDPVGPAQGEQRVLRGGSFYDLSTTVRSAARSDRRPNPGANGVGFRVARTYNVTP